MKNTTVATGTKLTKNAFKRTGYTFRCWSTKPDGTGATYTQQEAFTLKESDYHITSYGEKITLYAQWDKN